MNYLILLTLFIGLFLVQCSRDTSLSLSFQNNIEIQKDIKYESWDVNLNMWEDEVDKFLLVSDYMVSYTTESDDSEILEMQGNVHLDYTNKIENREITIYCDTLVFNRGESIFYFSGHVMLNTDKNLLLETQKLIWDRKEKRVSSNKFIKITSSTEQIQGIDFDSDIYISQYYINSASGAVNVDNQ